MSPFFTDARGVLQCEALANWPWLDHGFSTRQSAAWMEGSSLAFLKQIHSDKVITAREPGLQAEADALATQCAGLHVGIRTADCFPILLADPTHRAVAAIHSGWRGTVSGIAAKSIERMTTDFGSQPGELHALIGPGISVCCFEVGPEVATLFGANGRAHVDLAAALRDQLISAGVARARIYKEGSCTHCRPDLFWSYRREGEAAGRMWSGAGLVNGC